MDAIAASTSMKADQLNCSISWQRTKTKKNPLEVLDMALRAGIAGSYSFIFRDMSFINKPNYFDVGCDVTEGPIRYHLWLELSIEAGEALIKKHKLTSS